LEVHGPDEALRIIELDEIGRHVPTVTEWWLTTHIDNLTGVQRATLSRYRSYVARDVNPVFGSMPVSAVNETTIARWGSSSSVAVARPSRTNMGSCRGLQCRGARRGDGAISGDGYRQFLIEPHRRRRVHRGGEAQGAQAASDEAQPRWSLQASRRVHPVLFGIPTDPRQDR
jgi:hypothetical protein